MFSSDQSCMEVVSVTGLLYVYRPDGKVAFGYSLFRGKRSNMEDFHQAQVNTPCTAQERE